MDSGLYTVLLVSGVHSKVSRCPDLSIVSFPDPFFDSAHSHTEREGLVSEFNFLAPRGHMLLLPLLSRTLLARFTMHAYTSNTSYVQLTYVPCIRNGLLPDVSAI